MIKGFFIDNSPWVEVLIRWGDEAQRSLAVLDTGFTGDLQITPKMAQELRLKSSSTINVQIANGQTIKVPVVFAVSSMEGEIKYVQALVSDGTPLVGINFLSKFSYKATVDCKNKIVSLNRVTN